MGSILKEVSPKAYDFVTKVANELPKYVDDGADSGIWLGDQSSRHGEMDKRYDVQGINERSRENPVNVVGSQRSTAIDPYFVETFISPETSAYREP